MKIVPAPAHHGDPVMRGTLHLAHARQPGSHRSRVKTFHARDLALPWQIAEKRAARPMRDLP